MASPAAAAGQQAVGGEGAAMWPTAEQAPVGAGPQQPAAAGSVGAAGAVGAPPAGGAATPRSRSSSTVQMSASRALRMPGSSAPRYWEMHFVMHINDVNAGRAYYTHPDTGHTQWEIPPCAERGFALVRCSRSP